MTGLTGCLDAKRVSGRAVNVWYGRVLKADPEMPLAGWYVPLRAISDAAGSMSDALIRTGNLAAASLRSSDSGAGRNAAGKLAGAASRLFKASDAIATSCRWILADLKRAGIPPDRRVTPLSQAAVAARRGLGLLEETLGGAQCPDPLTDGTLRDLGRLASGQMTAEHDLALSLERAAGAVADAYGRMPGRPRKAGAEGPLRSASELLMQAYRAGMSGYRVLADAYDRRLHPPDPWASMREDWLP